MNRGVELGFYPRDLAFERRDAGMELVDRQRIEILFDERFQRIAWLVGKEFVQIHASENLPDRRLCQPDAAHMRGPWR